MNNVELTVIINFCALFNYSELKIFSLALVPQYALFVILFCQLILRKAGRVCSHYHAFFN